MLDVAEGDGALDENGALAVWGAIIWIWLSGSDPFGVVDEAAQSIAALNRAV